MGKVQPQRYHPLEDWQNACRDFRPFDALADWSEQKIRIRFRLGRDLLTSWKTAAPANEDLLLLWREKSSRAKVADITDVFDSWKEESGRTSNADPLASWFKLKERIRSFDSLRNWLSRALSHEEPESPLMQWNAARDTTPVSGQWYWTTGTSGKTGAS